MRKIKTTCHVCDLTMKTPGDQEAPSFCEYCGANLLNPSDETRALDSIYISTEAGGIKADVVTVILTNKRIIFTGEKSAEGAGSWIGWMLGGLIGGLIAGAISGAKGDRRQVVSVKFENMASLDVEFGTKLLNKNSKFFTIHDKDGNSYAFQPGKKEAEPWEDEIRKRIA